MYRIFVRILPVVCVLVAVFSLNAASQDKTDRLSAEDIFNFEFAADPQISPDGSQIVYVRRFSDIMTDRRYSNIWIVNFDGSDHRPLTNGHHSDSSPRWSPDGSQLVYTSNKDGSSQIYKRWMDTGQTVALTNIQSSPSGLAWAPDGNYISFSANVPEKPRQIVKPPTPPKGAEWAKPPIVLDRLVYRFNGRGYLNGYSHLFVIPSEGGTPRQISSGNFDHTGTGIWTPDSKSIILSVNRRDDAEYENRDTEVYEFEVATGKVKALTHRKGPDNSPSISPDGKSIAYTGYDDRYQGFQLTKLYVMDRDGSNSRVIINDLDRSVSSVRWSNDGRGVYFVYTNQGNTKLAYTSLSGKYETIADDVGRGGYSVAKNGNFAYVYTTSYVPADIAAGSKSGGKVKALTAVNEDLFAYKELGKVEEIWYESSFDKRKIHGWIIKPPGFDPSRKYPLIIGIHGGPFANYGSRFDLEKQLMAASDYVVLFTNPRGSTSYGEEFASLIHHNYPSEDFHDLNSGVTAVVEKGYIDEDNLFVTGGSGGGVLTAWMIGHTDRFRAAVSFYPVINWYSWTLTADIPITGVKYWFPGMPWDNVEHYENRSLLSVVKNVTTPTMIMTGEEDWRTPMSESEQYYTALKLMGVEAVLVRVPNEPHGISRRPSHHVSKVQHLIAWFDQHKKE